MYERSYEELVTFPTFEERFRYLMLGGIVCEETFGFDRYLNQRFYTSTEWKRFRRDIITRDFGCDLGVDDGLHEIHSKVLIHHINPITPEDIIRHRTDILLDPNNAICVSGKTHQAIHYGDESAFATFADRRAGDTKLW